MTSLCDSIAEKVARPIVSELSKEAQQAISMRVVVRNGSEFMDRQLEVGDFTQGARATGEMRVVVKGPLGDSIKFTAEAVFEGLSPESGFSGFSVKGRLESRALEIIAKIDSRSNRYNVRTWGKEYRDF